MKNHLLSATSVAALLGYALFAAPALAQQPGQRPAAAPRAAQAAPHAGIVVIDINHIYENHVRLKAQMEAFKTELQQADAALKKEYEELKRLAEHRNNFKPGTPDYNQIDAQLTKLQVEFKVKTEQQKKQFAERQAAMIVGLYREIQQELQYFAQQNGIRLIVRFSREPADASNPNAMLNEVNKNIVYHDPRLDITDVILNALNARAQAPVSAATRPGPAGPAQAIPRNNQLR